MLIYMKDDTHKANYSNDNDPDFWSSIGLQAAMIVNKLRLQTQLDSAKQENEDGEGDTNAGRRYQERGAKHGSRIP